jgi:6,7-dimethyl-8-ribityllumazine synthase
MLRAPRKSARKPARGGRFVIVASRYNARYVDGMVRAAKAELAAAKAAVEVVRVPGAFEIPVAAAVVARRRAGRPGAVICLGLIWQGETTHAQHIGEAVTDALMRVAVETGVPMIHEVLTIATADQARARCLSPETNRGTEAARTALDMAALLADLREAEDDAIPF